MKLPSQLTFSIAVALLAMAVAHQTSLADSVDKKEKDGVALLEKEGCFHCHFIAGDGGFVGPPLAGIAKYRTADEIVNTLTGKRPLPPADPKSVFDPGELMRHVKLDKKTAEAIANYLIANSSQDSFQVNGHRTDAKEDLPAGFTFVPRVPSDQSRKGFLAYKESGCAACHEIGGIGGRRGPALDGVGARLSKDAIAKRVTAGAIITFNEKEYKPTEYSMPPSQLPEEQVALITEFLLTLPEKPGQ